MQFPILHGSEQELSILETKISFALNKIQSNEYFTTIRYQDIWWNKTNKAYDQAVAKFGLKGKKPKWTGEFLNAWTDFWMEEWNARKEPYKFNKFVIRKNLETIVESKDDNFFMMVKAMQKNMRVKMMEYVPEREFHYAHMWRRAATDGSIHQLFEQNRDEKIVLVAPYYYKNFGEKLRLGNFEHIEIDNKFAARHIRVTADDLIDKHRQRVRGKEKVIYILVGGATGNALATLIHGLDKAFIMEIGRALDVYYSHDKALTGAPGFMWSPCWLGKAQKPEPWTEWIFDKNVKVFK